MPSRRKRIGYLPSVNIQKIITNIAKKDKLSQSKVVGILVEEALTARSGLELQSSNDLIKKNRSFGISILKSNQKPIAEYFSKDNPLEDDVFNYQEMPGGQFVISESIAQFECKIIKETC